MANFSMQPQNYGLTNPTPDYGSLAGFGSGVANPTAIQNPMGLNNLAAPNMVPAPTQFGGPMPMAQGNNPYGVMGNWGGNGSPDTGGFFGNGMGLGANMPTAQLGLGALGALSNLWMGSKSLGLAKDQFNFTKETTNTNLNNQLKTYNSSLEDRLRTRGQYNGDEPNKANEEYERRKLSR